MRGTDRSGFRPATKSGSGPTLTPAIDHPAFSRPVQVVTIPRPTPTDDETATAQTIAYMMRLARRDATAPAVRQAAAAAIAGASSVVEAAAGIHRWIRDRVAFVSDADLAQSFTADPDAEILIPPADLLTMPVPMGDCDDFSTLAAAMLTAAGIPYAFVTVAADESTADYSHVYDLAIDQGRPIALDASHGPNLGWQATPTGKRRVWKPKETAFMRPQTLRGLGFNWDAFSKITTAGISTAGQILIPRYAVPQMQSGQYIQTQQGVMYQQPAGSSAAFGLPVAGTGGNSLLWLLGGVAVVVLMASSRR